VELKIGLEEAGDHLVEDKRRNNYD